MSVTYAAAEDRYTIQAFVENVENRVQRTGLVVNYTGPFTGVNGDYRIGPQPFGYLNFATTSLRYYGVRLGAKF